MKKTSYNKKEHQADYVYIKLNILVNPMVKGIVDLGDKIENMSLRQIGETVGIGNSPQKVKHHLLQLLKMGVVDLIGGKYVFHKIKQLNDYDK